MQLLCPACGAELQFKSRLSIFGVCSYCAATIVRHDMDLEMLGKMATLPPDMSPLQLGTRGTYDSRSFEVVGRLKIAWQDGTWNEWHVLFDDQRTGWLAEAQGLWMMSFQQHHITDVPARDRVDTGQSIRLGDHVFEVTDIKNATCIGSEGELPLTGTKGRKSTSVDLVGPGHEFACIDYAQDGIRVYLGSYIDLEALSLTHLRALDGW